MIDSILLVLLTVAVGIERLVEVIKPSYLKAKKFFTKRDDLELTGTEKIIMSIAIGVAGCLIAGFSGVESLTPFKELPAVTQWVLIGLIGSFGSNVLHPIIGLVAAFKDFVEGLKKV